MQKQRMNRRDMLIILLLVLATASVVGYRQWVRSQRPTGPLDLGGLPGVVVISQEDCLACLAQQRLINDMAPQYEGRAKLVVLNLHEHIELARQLEVQFVPTILFLNADGDIVETYAGYVEEEDLAAKLDALIES